MTAQRVRFRHRRRISDRMLGLIEATLIVLAVAGIVYVLVG